MGLGPPGTAEPAVTEVHLRRLDREDMLHRRAVAVISIDASAEQVCHDWKPCRGVRAQVEATVGVTKHKDPDSHEASAASDGMLWKCSLTNERGLLPTAHAGVRKLESLLSVMTPDLAPTHPQVYKVLTDYERLPEFVPNLAITERVPLPEGSPPNLVRLRQVRPPARIQSGLSMLMPRTCRSLIALAPRSADGGALPSLPVVVLSTRLRMLDQPQ